MFLALLKDDYADVRLNIISKLEQVPLNPEFQVLNPKPCCCVPPSQNGRCDYHELPPSASMLFGRPPAACPQCAPQPNPSFQAQQEVFVQMQQRTRPLAHQ